MNQATPPHCPACKAAIAPTATTCDFCRARLGHDPRGAPVVVVPDVRPGDPVVLIDFRYAPLPGQTARDVRFTDHDACTGTAGGVQFETTSDQWVRRFAQPNLRMRDACVRASCVVQAPGVEPIVFLRQATFDIATVRYELQIRPHTSQVSMWRYCGLKTEAGARALLPWMTHPAVARVGLRNVLEFRAQGPTLQAWINGTFVAAVHDGVLGIGGVGLTVSRNAPKNTERLATLWEWFEARMVTA